MNPAPVPLNPARHADSGDYAIAIETVLMGHHPQNAIDAQAVVDKVRVLEAKETPQDVTTALPGGARRLPIEIVSHLGGTAHNAKTDPQASLVIETPEGQSFTIAPPDADGHLKLPD